MKKLILSTALTVFTAGSAFAATEVQNIDALHEDMDDRMATVSGVVSWVEDANEFTIADKTGDIEVNLEANRPGIDEGDYVTVTGEVSDGLLDDALIDATVTVNADDYDAWEDDYYAEYEVRYDRDGLDSVFYETIDWDNDIYDDYYLVRTN